MPGSCRTDDSPRPLIQFTRPAFLAVVPKNNQLDRRMPTEAGQPSGRGTWPPQAPPPPRGGFFPPAPGLHCRHGHRLEEPGTRAVGALPRWPSALTVRAAREGGACPRQGLPRALRRGHGHQLFTRLLLSVRAEMESMGSLQARCT